MRYYKGDWMRRITMSGYNMPAQETVPVRVMMETDSSYYMEKHLDGRITLVRVLFIVERPWYNHLRAFWDSIFQP